MSAQDHGATSAANRTDEGYGAASAAQPLVNGVGEGLRQGEASDEHRGQLVQENPNLYDPAPHPPVVAPERTGRLDSLEMRGEMEPPYSGRDQHLQGQVQTLTPTPVAPVVPYQEPPLTRPMSGVYTQEFFTAQSRTTTTASPEQPQGGRWMTRVTEFLRTTAHRGVVGVDRMLDSLGLQQVHVTSSFGNPELGQGSVVTSMRGIDISPPEELPSRSTPPQAPPVPLSWSRTGRQEPPLFAQEQIERLRQAQRDHPLLLGQPSEEGSEHSSRLQAEVQRQLEEYASRYRDEVHRLQQEVQLLRRERSGWLREGDLAQGREAAQGNATQFQGNLPQQVSQLPQPPRDPAQSVATEATNYNPPLPSPGVYEATRLPPIPPRDVPQPLGLYEAASEPPRPPGEEPQHFNVPQGQPVSLHPPAPRDLLEPHAKAQAPVPARDVSDAPGNATQFRGNLPQQVSRPFIPIGTGTASGVNVGLQQAGGDGSSGLQQAGGDGPLGEAPSSMSAKQWLGQQGTDGTIAMLADGMAQLQAAMIKQIEKKDDGDKSPETVKPGTLALPLLKEVCSETSCVDIMDWMEVIDGPMSDLSDSSASWWKRVTTEAYRAYSLWSLASPLDRLSISPEVGDLEDGKYTRLNSRAAAMLVAALHESVRQEVVSRRLAGSTVRLVYRLLTMYQPGGEGEKLKILSNLQSPSPESDATRAVSSLRTWNRWLRRCRDLGVQAPDPSLLARGLTRMVKAVLERNQEATFRTSLVKSTLQIDTNPSYDRVESYFKHLMAECEALAVAANTSTSTSSTTTTVVGPNPILRSFFTWLSSMWECDDLSVLSEGNPIKFLGMELHEVDNGIEISQEGFIKELLRAHQHEGKRAKTQGPKELLIMSAEEETKMLEAQPVDLTGKEKIVKEAQRRVGELNWLSSRSRPDIQYATAVMASRITRCPEAVVTIGDRLLDYLHETIKDRLRFANDKGEEQQLRAYTDSSFAPSSGRTHGAVAIFYGTCPLAWRSSRQPLIALSIQQRQS